MSYKYAIVNMTCTSISETIYNPSTHKYITLVSRHVWCVLKIMLLTSLSSFTSVDSWKFTKNAVSFSPRNAERHFVGDGMFCGVIVVDSIYGVGRNQSSTEAIHAQRCPARFDEPYKWTHLMSMAKGDFRPVVKDIFPLVLFLELWGRTNRSKLHCDNIVV